MTPVSDGTKACLQAELLDNTAINEEIFRLEFIWNGPVPQAGQFFMIHPRRSSLFLSRPISMALWDPAAEDNTYITNKGGGKKNPYVRFLAAQRLNSNTVIFLIARRGKGTSELSELRAGEEAELTGPLGNTWAGFLPPGIFREGSIALVGGGIGIAPLTALASELPEDSFDFYAGFRTGFATIEERYGLLGAPILSLGKVVIATEDGSEGFRGRIPDFLDPARYAAVCACGPEPMLKAVAARCNAAGTPCFISLERRMACGVGACLGCAAPTVNGNRRVCADGPIFNAQDVVFDA
ncbi:MAG: dihydroorotate dehydrogenase electron transfer subunit [Treponema sp.]|jgi:NAD(P)H-flavin reductase|nr:dihydroorotate dehydrogenase electron transfer subunit [Treponema sp.]